MLHQQKSDRHEWQFRRKQRHSTHHVVFTLCGGESQKVGTDYYSPHPFIPWPCLRPAAERVDAYQPPIYTRLDHRTSLGHVCQPRRPYSMGNPCLSPTGPNPPDRHLPVVVHHAMIEDQNHLEQLLVMAKDLQEMVNALLGKDNALQERAIVLQEIASALPAGPLTV